MLNQATRYKRWLMFLSVVKYIVEIMCEIDDVSDLLCYCCTVLLCLFVFIYFVLFRLGTWPDEGHGSCVIDLTSVVASLFLLGLVFVFCVFSFWCCLVVSTQCGDQLPGKTRLWNYLLCVEWDVKPYSLTFWLDDIKATCIRFLVSLGLLCWHISVVICNCGLGFCVVTWLPLDLVASTRQVGQSQSSWEDHLQNDLSCQLGCWAVV